MKRIGFVINSRVPDRTAWLRGMRPHGWLFGWNDSGSPMSFMRFRWIADALRRDSSPLCYELYRPWRKYDAVVFLKSMGERCLALAAALRRRGVRVIFEANVDYYTPFEGMADFDAMAPTTGQRADAAAMTSFADAVIASSRHLAEVIRPLNPRTTWIPDNVNFALRPAVTGREFVCDGRLQVWWSGMVEKLSDFLVAEEAFARRSEMLHLHFVTGALETARMRWPTEIRERMDRFLRSVPHTFHEFRGIPELLRLYARGGVIVSPRSLASPYNLSHTEWKITLGMACGLPAIASPVPSYLDASRGAEGAVTICRTADEWEAALENAAAHPERLREQGGEAESIARSFYETGVVARQHAAAVESALTHAEP